jgi:hypothetical protein
MADKFRVSVSKQNKSTNRKDIFQIKQEKYFSFDPFLKRILR